MNCFVETSVLTDYLLKKDGSETRASAAFARFRTISVPQFAWKEFKRGPLTYFTWAHNKLADTGSLSGVLDALRKVMATPQQYLKSSAVQALQSATATFPFKTLGALRAHYGDNADPNRVMGDAIRVELKRAILQSWKNRATSPGQRWIGSHAIQTRSSLSGRVILT